MTDVETLLLELEAEWEKLFKARTDLKAAEAREGEAQVALDAAVRDCYLGAISPAEEDRARAACAAVAVEIDRLRRILPMLEARVKEKQEALSNAQWAEDLHRAPVVESEIDAVLDQIINKEEEIDSLGQQIRAVLERNAPVFKRLNRPAPSPQERVHALRKARDLKRGRELFLY